MENRVTFLLGRAGSGKTRCLYHGMAQAAKAGERVTYIVPEQFTFETERSLAMQLGGLMDIKVCSFTSLARRVLRETGEDREFLSLQGKRMVIRKCANDNEDRLLSFGGVCRRPGFAEECDDHITMFKRANISPADLSTMADKLPETGALRAKLSDLAIIYSAFEDHLEKRSMDGEDMLRALAKCLPRSKVAGSHIVIDGFDLISLQLYDILSVLMDISPSMTVSLRLDTDPRARDAHVFQGDRAVYEKLTEMAREKGLGINTVNFPVKDAPWGESRHIKKSLAHLEHEAFAYPVLPYEGENDGGIRLFSGTDMAAEAEAAADMVLHLAMHGTRYSEMAVIATDMGAYREAVSRALRKRGIPFFTDDKHPLSGYGAARLVSGALACAAKGYPRQELLSVAKTGLGGIDRRQCEALENYLLATGLTGSRVEEAFDTENEIAEAAREKLVAPIAKLRRRLSASPTAGDKCRAIYEYMEDIGLRTSLEELCEKLRSKNELELMEETAQVYNTLMELISQLHAIMGGMRLSTARFYDMFREGLDSYEVGVIPTAADQLLFGSLERSRARELKALFVLGAAQGLFPSAIQDDRLINDGEIAALEKLGAEGLPLSRDIGAKALADVYGAVSKPTELLWLSWPLSGKNGEPCPLADRIVELYPFVEVENDIEGGLPLSTESAYARLMVLIREGAEAGGLSNEGKALLAALLEDEKYRERIESLKTYLKEGGSFEPLGSEVANRLYGGSLRGSASRLETFAACPFRHFANFGLKLAPRHEYRERKADEGVFCHEALCAFTLELMKLKKPFVLVDEEEAEGILENILPALAATHNGGILLTGARHRAVYARLIKKVKLTAHVILAQLKAGSFRPVGCEVSFGRGCDYPPILLDAGDGVTYELSGRIDRIDGFDREDGRYLRIIDYKTGNTHLDFADMAAGLKLQLPLYMAAVCAAADAEGKANARAAGMYYLPVKTTALKDGVMTAEDLEAAVLKELRLSGLTLKDSELIEAGGGSVALPTKSPTRIAEARDMDNTLSYALHIAGEKAREIGRGAYEASPAKRGNTDPCQYCDYSTLCGFDPAIPGCAYRNIRSRSAEVFFKEAGEHGKVDS